MRYVYFQWDERLWQQIFDFRRLQQLFHYLVTVTSGDVEMNDEHSDYRWITGDPGDLHPFVAEMIERAGIFYE